MATPSLTLAELTQFGVTPEDEGPHAFDPAVEWWNESWFWDWFDADGRVAGHCRIGIHPNQQRAWLWLYLYRDGEWIALEETRLPLSDLDPASLSYDRWGLRFSHEVSEPLRAGHLRVDGFGRVVRGPRAGTIQAVGADLEIQAQGAAHSMGRAAAAGHESETTPASRFEQPTSCDGTLRIGDELLAFHGRGERDHSWGPRHWNLEWNFLVLGGEGQRLQCAEARIPNVGRFPVGYLLRDTSVSLSQVDFDLTFSHDDLERPVSGRFSVKAEDGTTLEAALEVVSAAEIDITHTFVPPQRSVYRRALVRAHPEGGGAPLMGWLEFNAFEPR